MNPERFKKTQNNETKARQKQTKKVKKKTAEKTWKSQKSRKRHTEMVTHVRAESKNAQLAVTQAKKRLCRTWFVFFSFFFVFFPICNHYFAYFVANLFLICFLWWFPWRILSDNFWSINSLKLICLSNVDIP